MIRNNGFFLLVCVALLATIITGNAQTVNIYVSPTGLATGNGSTSATAVNFARAKVVARANVAKPCVIQLLNGTYATSFSLDNTDTRTAAAPLTIKAVTARKAIIQPITAVNKADFKPIPDSIKSRIIDTTARKNVLQLDLSTYGLGTIADWRNVFSYPVTITPTTSSRQLWPKFFLNGALMPMSQYPNTGTMVMNGVLNKGSSRSVPGGSFKYSDTRINLWQNAVKDGLWLRGNWRVDWQMDFVKTLSISPSDSTIVQVEGVSGGLGYKYSPYQGSLAEPFVAVNLVEEIDKEGEWCIHPVTKMVYMWVPAAGNIGVAYNSSVAGLNLTNVSNVVIENLSFSAGAGDGIKMTNCINCTVAGNDIANCSGYGVFIVGGNNCVVRSNDIHQVGQGGVFLVSSNFTNDQKTLLSSNHKVVNNLIYSYAKEVFLYSAAVDSRNAIGTYVANNKIYDCPHVGVLYGGNNNIMEYNDISDVVKTYSDMGAFYTAENWTERGDTIRYNYIHNMSYKGSGLYPDNYASGHSFTYNIAADCYYGSQNNFGYFNKFDNNVYYNNFMAHHVNQTGFVPDTNRNCTTNLNNLKNIYTNNPVYQSAYPELIDLFGANGSNTAYTSQLWPSVSCNVFLGTGGNSQVLRSVVDTRLFNSNGTTNTTFATTGDPFVRFRLIFLNNLRIARKPSIRTAALLLDTLKRNNVFSKTCGTDWRIGRLGLYIDSIYRKDITATQTPGVKPIFNVSVSSSNNFSTVDTIRFLVKVVNPGIKNTFTSLRLMEKGAIVTNVDTLLLSAVNDTITYELKWHLPVLGTHKMVVQLWDSPNWRFYSDTVTVTINAPLPIQIAKFAVVTKDCKQYVQWTAFDESEVGQYQLQYSSDGQIFTTLSYPQTICAPFNTCNYQIEIPALTADKKYIRLLVKGKNGQTLLVTKAVEAKSCLLGGLQMQLLPNLLPQGGNITCSYESGIADAKATVQCYSTSGHLIWQKPFFLQKGKHLLQISEKMLPGNYLIVLKGINTSQWQKLIIY